MHDQAVLVRIIPHCLRHNPGSSSTVAGMCPVLRTHYWAEVRFPSWSFSFSPRTSLSSSPSNARKKELVSLSLRVFQLSSFVEPRLFIFVDLNPSPAHYALPPLKVDGARSPKAQPRYTPCRTLLLRRRRSNRLHLLQIRLLTWIKITVPMSLGLPLTVILVLRKMDHRVA